jgi:hypothetical protein
MRPIVETIISPLNIKVSEEENLKAKTFSQSPDEEKVLSEYAYMIAATMQDQEWIRTKFLIRYEALSLCACNASYILYYVIRIREVLRANICNNIFH